MDFGKSRQNRHGDGVDDSGSSLLGEKVLRSQSGTLNVLYQLYGTSINTNINIRDKNANDNGDDDDDLLLLMSRLPEFQKYYYQIVELLNEYFGDYETLSTQRLSNSGSSNKDNCDFRIENYNTVFAYLEERNPILSFGCSFNLEEYTKNILQHVVKREWHITFAKECVHCGVIIHRLMNIENIDKHRRLSKIFSSFIPREDHFWNCVLKKPDESRIYFEVQIHFKTIRNNTNPPDFEWLEKCDNTMAQDLLSLFMQCNLEDTKNSNFNTNTNTNNHHQQKRKIDDYFKGGNPNGNGNNTQQQFSKKENNVPNNTGPNVKFNSSFFYNQQHQQQQQFKKRKLNIDAMNEMAVYKKFVDLYNYCLNEKYDRESNDTLTNNIVELMTFYVHNQMITTIISVIELVELEQKMMNKMTTNSNKLNERTGAKSINQQSDIDYNHITLYLSEIYKRKNGESPVVKSDMMNNFRQAWSNFLKFCATNNSNRNGGEYTIYNQSLSLLIKHCFVTDLKESNLCSSFMTKDQEIRWEQPNPNHQIAVSPIATFGDNNTSFQSHKDDENVNSSDNDSKDGSNIFCVVTGSRIDVMSNFFKIKIGVESNNDIYIYAKNESAKNLCTKLLLIVNTFTLKLKHYLNTYTHKAYKFISDRHNDGTHSTNQNIGQQMNKIIRFIGTYYDCEPFIEYQKKNNIIYSVNDFGAPNINSNNQHLPNMNHVIHSCVIMIISNIQCLVKYKKKSNTKKSIN